MNLNCLNKQKVRVFTLIFFTKYLAFRTIHWIVFNEIPLPLGLFYELSLIKPIQAISENPSLLPSVDDSLKLLPVWKMKSKCCPIVLET